jgi:hypothetical protein
MYRFKVYVSIRCLIGLIIQMFVENSRSDCILFFGFVWLCHWYISSGPIVMGIMVLGLCLSSIMGLWPY